jgi:hypothetical protein
MNNTIKFSLITAGVVIFLIIISKIPGKSLNSKTTINIECVISSCQRLLKSAKQNSNPFVAFMFANSANCMLTTLKKLFTEKYISSKVSMNISSFGEDLRLFQQEKLDTIRSHDPVAALDLEESISEVDWFV